MGRCWNNFFIFFGIQEKRRNRFNHHPLTRNSSCGDGCCDLTGNVNQCCNGACIPNPEREMEDATAAGEDVLLVEVRGPVRVITLNRPRQLNTLTRPMVEGLHALYSAYEADPSVKCVVLRGAGGGRALCAGGDVRAVHDMRPRPGDPRRAHAPIHALEFFFEEYKMDLLLHNMTTPHVALMDGVVMGGGCGVSINGKFRVATERTVGRCELTQPIA